MCPSASPKTSLCSLAGLFAGLFLLFQSPAAADVGAEWLAANFQARFAEAMAEEEIPGAAFVLVHRGQVLRMGTIGRTRRAGGRAVDSHTRFRIASVSKGFAGVLAGILAEDGKFSWDEPITFYAPDFRFRGPPQTITIHDVVGHRTGFIPNAYDNLIEAGLERDEIYTHFASLEPICTPGSCYTYQNTAFSLVEPVLEQVSGESYAGLLSERIFGPLGMTGASVGFDSYMQSDNRAEPHVRRMNSWQPIPIRSTYYQVGSAAGVNASILDMAQWAVAILGHRSDVISGEVLERVLVPGIRTTRDLSRRYWREHLSDAHYGLGWRIYRLGENELIYHGGWVSGFRAEIGLSREHDLGLVILMNAESSVITELSRDFWTAAFERLQAPPSATLSGASSIRP